MKMYYHRSIVLIVASIFSFGISAQNQVEINTHAAGLQGLPLQRNEFSAAVPFLQVDFSNKERVGTLKVDGYRPFGGVVTAGLEVTTPFDTNSNSSVLSNFDGLGDNTSVAVRFAYNRMSSKAMLSLNPGSTKDICAKYWPGSNAPTSCSGKEVEDNAKKHFASLPGDNRLSECAKYLVSDTDCNEAGFGKALRRDMGRASTEYAGEVVRSIVAAVKLEYGRNSYEYFDADSLSEAEDKQEPYLISGGVGYLFKKNLVAVGAQYLQTFRPAEEQQFCVEAFAPVGSSRCFEGPIGKATTIKRKNAYVEWRSQPSRWRVAFSPRIIRDFQSSEWAFRLPIYFVGNEDSEFTGGVRLEWDTAREDLQGSLFIGKSFGFLD